MGRRARGMVAALVLSAVVVPAGAQASSRTPWRVGAATVSTTPPPFDAARDRRAFPACPPAVFSGRRRFALEEPYVDSDGSGEFDYQTDAYCDANANGRYDGIYVSGGVDHLARRAHDPIQARAVALSDGRRTVVVVSVVSQGLFENYIARMRERARALIGPGLTDMVVSANHNESSPDTIGIYGAPADPTGTFGVHSGIDDYYMDFLVERVAQAAKRAYDHRVPARLAVRSLRLPPADLRVHLSDNFPTTDDQGKPAAIDPKVRILSARDRHGEAIATVMNLAAHNQEIGHSQANARDLSADWPGYFERRLDDELGGVSIFLVGDNGSEEDPITQPPVAEEGTYKQARATGHAFAALVKRQAAKARPVRFGRVSFERRTFQVPVENNLFKAAFAARLFGDRTATPGPEGLEITTHVSVLGVGPDLQFIANPGEAFPALMLGSPWGREDVGCPNRPNPPVPAWHARAANRFEVGLADDLIGYEIPAWAFSSQPGVFANTDANADACVNDSDDRDPRGHQHKLESEGVGPTASNRVATQLADLLGRDPDPRARIRAGRFIRRDGSLSHSAAGAVGVWLAAPGSSRLEPGKGTIVALRRIGAFGDVPVDRTGVFMDYDGGAQRGGPDITTRGMVVAGDGCARARRYYVDVYPPLEASSLGAARRNHRHPAASTAGRSHRHC